MSSMALFTGCSCATLAGAKEDTVFEYKSADELKSERGYAWNPAGNETIYDDLKDGNENYVFFRLHLGDYTFEGNEIEQDLDTPRTIWMDAENDKRIPTITAGEHIIYVSDTQVPEQVVFERFADYGYTIGVANLVADDGDHYYIPYCEQEDDDYKYYIDMESDAAELAEFDNITRLYLDKVGDIKVNKDSVTDGGTVSGLNKGEDYVCEFYTGTYYQDYLLKADIHTFCSFERFVSFKFEFLHSNCISLTIPDYFVSGYYVVNGLGLFRYVAEEDIEAYKNGDEIDWNKPMILYDEYGYVTYDPSEEVYEDGCEDIDDREEEPDEEEVMD